MRAAKHLFVWLKTTSPLQIFTTSLARPSHSPSVPGSPWLRVWCTAGSSWLNLSLSFWVSMSECSALKFICSQEGQYCGLLMWLSLSAWRCWFAWGACPLLLVTQASPGPLTPHSPQSPALPGCGTVGRVISASGACPQVTILGPAFLGHVNKRNVHLNIRGWIDHGLHLTRYWRKCVAALLAGLPLVARLTACSHILDSKQTRILRFR